MNVFLNSDVNLVIYTLVTLLLFIFGLTVESAVSSFQNKMVPCPFICIIYTLNFSKLDCLNFFFNISQVTKHTHNAMILYDIVIL